MGDPELARVNYLASTSCSASASKANTNSQTTPSTIIDDPPPSYHEAERTRGAANFDEVLVSQSNSLPKPASRTEQGGISHDDGHQIIDGRAWRKIICAAILVIAFLTTVLAIRVAIVNS